MVLTDNELSMLEQLTYLDAAVVEAAGLGQSVDFKGINNGHSSMSIGEILAYFDEEALKKLEAKDYDIGDVFISGKECADFIRALQNSRMKDLELQSTMTDANGKPLALCFAENGNTSDAIVAFKGTSGEEEWRDNVDGLILSDTPKQKEALDYIECLPYDSITVTGHSKGGNKAMYVAITSSKVERCVALDAQGFSLLFLDKYWAEILQKKEIIINYSLATDYVHPLILQIPGAEQVYCEGYDISNPGHHHSSSSFFPKDADGNFLLDENGAVMFVKAEKGEHESVQMLHGFTVFLMYNASDTDKEIIVEYLGEILALTFGEGGDNQDAIINSVLKDPDTLAVILAYLVKYMQEYDLNAEDIDILLYMLGLDSLNDLFNLVEFKIPIIGKEVEWDVNLVLILNYLKDQLNDDNDDWILKEMVLPSIKAIKFSDLELDVTDFWEKINSKIKEIDASEGCADAELRSGTTRDFSLGIYNTLMSTIGRIEQIGAVSLHTWGNYAYEEWYSTLPVGKARNAIGLYFWKLSETNQSCKTMIDAIFSQVEEIDTKSSNLILMRYYQLQSMNKSIAAIADGIVG